MPRAPIAVIAAVLLGVTATACAGVTGFVDDTQEDIDELSDRARFCFALARVVNAVESGSPATAREAAQEAFAQAPSEVRGAAREVIDALEEADASGERDLTDPEVRRAAERLRDEAAGLCDATQGAS